MSEAAYYCTICREPVPEDWSEFCSDCLHIPGRRRVWGRLNAEEQDWEKRVNGQWWEPAPEYGWTYTWKNWTWVPIGDGSGLGVIVKMPATEQKIQAALAQMPRSTT